MLLSTLNRFLVLSAGLIVGVNGQAGPVVMTDTGPVAVGGWITFTCDYTPHFWEYFVSLYWTKHDFDFGPELKIKQGSGNTCTIENDEDFLEPSRMELWCDSTNNRFQLTVRDITMDDYYGGKRQFCCMVLADTGGTSAYGCGRILYKVGPPPTTSTVSTTTGSDMPSASDDAMATKSSLLLCSLILVVYFLL